MKLNTISRIDFVLDALETSELVLTEDVAWIALTQPEMDELPNTFMCPVRFVTCAKHRGVELRVSQWVSEGHRIYPVWNSTKRTNEFMTKPNSKHAGFKCVI